MSALSFLLACSPAIDSAAEDYAEVREAVSDGGSWKIAYLPDPDPVPFNEIFGLEISIVGCLGLVDNLVRLGEHRDEEVDEGHREEEEVKVEEGLVLED